MKKDESRCEYVLHMIEVSASLMQQRQSLIAHAGYLLWDYPIFSIQRLCNGGLRPLKSCHILSTCKLLLTSGTKMGPELLQN